LLGGKDAGSPVVVHATRGGVPRWRGSVPVVHRATWPWGTGESSYGDHHCQVQRVQGCVLGGGIVLVRLLRL
jgi:hypothetical protein